MISLLQPNGERVCYITGSTRCLERHHIYPGGLRQISEENGFWVWLNHDIHAIVQQSSDSGMDEYLRRKCQAEYEKSHSRDDFINLIGRSYL